MQIKGFLSSFLPTVALSVHVSGSLEFPYELLVCFLERV